MGLRHKRFNFALTWPDVIVLACSISIFGPYIFVLGQWIRLEQIVFYGLFVFYLFTLRQKLAINIVGKLSISLLTLMLFYSALMTMIGHLSGSSPIKASNLTSILAGVDTLVFPIIVIITSTVLASKIGSQRSLMLLSFGVLAGLGSSTLVAIFQYSIPPTMLQWFWAGDGAESVGKLAQDSLRFTGLFNQPIEAGIAFSLGVVLIWALALNGYIRTALLSAVLIGGGLSGSKVILAGVAVAALLPLFKGDVIERLKGFSSAVVAILITTGFLYWQGSVAGFINRFMSPLATLDEIPQGRDLPAIVDQGIAAMTAGRFGENSVTNVVTSSTGLGLEPSSSALDSAITEASAKAGFVGIILIVALYLLLLISSLVSDRSIKGYPLRSATVLIMIVAGIGAGSLYLNRASTIFWMMITILLFSLKNLRTRSTALTQR